MTRKLCGRSLRQLSCIRVAIRCKTDGGVQILVVVPREFEGRKRDANRKHAFGHITSTAVVRCLREVAK